MRDFFKRKLKLERATHTHTHTHTPHILRVEIARAKKRFYYPLLTSKPATIYIYIYINLKAI